MSKHVIAKFYKSVDVAQDDNGFVVRLDGKPVRTSGRAVLALPKRALAEEVAAEWRAQGDAIDPATMPLTRLASASVDLAPEQRARVIEDILGYGTTDLLCYRAEAPAALVARQAAQWDPLLAWAEDALGARLAIGCGIGFVEQTPESQKALKAALESRDIFALVGLHGATAITGSLVLALAVAERRLTADEAFALGRLDERFQIETWGQDAEAEGRALRQAADLRAIARFLDLARS